MGAPGARSDMTTASIAPISTGVSRSLEFILYRFDRARRMRTGIQPACSVPESKPVACHTF